MAEESSHANDDAIMAQVEAIKKETVTAPAVGDLEPIQTLLDEFSNSDVFSKKIRSLLPKYTHLRRVRRDGNCFYRALLFGRLEDLITRLHSKEAGVATLAQLEYDTFLKTVKDSLKGLSDLGYPDVCEDFQESMVELLQSLEAGNGSEEKGKEEKLKNLLEATRDFGTSSALIMYLRLLTSMSLQQNFFLFEPFIEALGHQSIKAFCTSDVELMEQEADHPQISALSMILNFGLAIEYLDLSSGDSCNLVRFQEELPIRVTMLYRPGHYDLLYSLPSS